MPNHDDNILALLECPKCHGSIAPQERHWHCVECHLVFPHLGKIPWLYENPNAAVFDWRQSIKQHFTQLELDAHSIKNELADPKLLKSTARRLHRQLQALIEQKRHIESILDDVQTALLPDQCGILELSNVAKNRRPKTQSLTGYYNNIHRDWSWDSEVDENENTISFELVSRHLKDHCANKTVAILGGGACRLPYDIHRHLQPKQTLILDINPLLFYTAKKIFAGQSVNLYEFPLAPMDTASFAKQRKCRATEPLKEGVHFILADAMNPPFKPASLDVIITPWLIDIIPQDLREFLPRIATVLKPGGTWLNFGSLAFSHSRFSKQYSLEEVFEIAEQSGFKIASRESAVIPYMQSPASNHGRLERVTVFSATRYDSKSPQGKTKAFNFLPDWLTDSQKPIPRDPAIDTFQITHQTFVDVTQLIDGKRPLEQIAEIFSTKHQIAFEDAKEALTQFLANLYEQQQSAKFVFR